MDIQNTQNAVPTAQANTMPPPNQVDAAKDPQGKIAGAELGLPMPIPLTPSQTGLVSKAAMPAQTVSEQANRSGPSAIERTLKPYGINMLPEPKDAVPDSSAQPDLPDLAESEGIKTPSE